ncbi:MAG TPA: hypothetical protein VFM93_08455 [Candidatus Limnocylindria bacterium]|nr:hypothetical protein [Candidatus Limnocylindria bacterium]
MPAFQSYRAPSITAKPVPETTWIASSPWTWRPVRQAGAISALWSAVPCVGKPVAAPMSSWTRASCGVETHGSARPRATTGGSLSALWTRSLRASQSR